MNTLGRRTHPNDENKILNLFCRVFYSTQMYHDYLSWNKYVHLTFSWF